jgi:hypothetical protein
MKKMLWLAVVIVVFFGGSNHAAEKLSPAVADYSCLEHRSRPNRSGRICKADHHRGGHCRRCRAGLLSKQIKCSEKLKQKV